MTRRLDSVSNRSPPPAGVTPQNLVLKVHRWDDAGVGEAPGLAKNARQTWRVIELGVAHGDLEALVQHWVSLAPTVPDRIHPRLS